MKDPAINQMNDPKSGSKKISTYVSKIDLIKKSDEIKILKFVKLIGFHRNTADQIIELRNGDFVSFGTENRIFFYDRYFNLKLITEELSDWVYHILEITSQDKIGKEIQVIACTNKNSYLIQINIEKNTSRIQQYETSGVLCLEIKKNNYIVCGCEGADHFSDLFSKIIQCRKNKLFTELYRGGIVLNSNLVVFSSNRAWPSGEDKLKFYNPNAKKISLEVSSKDCPGMSFILSPNGLLLIESENEELNKIFLTANKKYYEGQKNGILMVISKFDSSNKINIKFEDTGNFEVYCFCPIFKIDKDKNKNEPILSEEIHKIDGIKTNYFFVGGFDQDSRQGLIKLYKANFNENVEETTIEFIQDIKIEEEIENIYNDELEANKMEENKGSSYERPNAERITQDKQNINGVISIMKKNNYFISFDGPVTSIIQSSTTGNILATCLDGKIYLLTPPNIDYYLNN